MGNETNTTTETVDETSTVTEPQTETVTPSTTATDERSETTSETTKPETSQPSSTEDLTKELAQLKAQLKKVNAESAAHRHKAKELDDLKAQIEAEKLSEKEKLEKKLSELQLQHDTATRQAQERIINYEVRLQAAQMGIVDPDAAAKLLDWSEIEYEDNGAPTNVQELLNTLVKNKPYLKAQTRATQTSGGATNPPRSTTSGASTASEYIKRMEQGKLSDSEYSSLPASMKYEIQAELAKARSRHR